MQDRKGFTHTDKAAAEARDRCLLKNGRLTVQKVPPLVERMTAPATGRARARMSLGAPAEAMITVAKIWSRYVVAAASVLAPVLASTFPK